MTLLRIAAIGAIFGLGIVGCAPDTHYLKSESADRLGRGPAACVERCHEFGMEMGALVLTSEVLPACVCTPRSSPADGAPAKQATMGDGAGAAIVIAAAAAAADERRRQQAVVVQQQQHQRIYHH